MDVQTTSADRASESERPFAAARGYTPLNWSAASNRELEWEAGAELRPYYHAEGITIFHGDCRVILPRLKKLDLLCTDPPYGIGFAAQPTNYQRAKGMKRETWDNDTAEEWLIGMARSKAERQIIWGGNYYDLPRARCLLSWYKPDAPPSMGNVEYAWTNLNQNSRQISHSISATNAERLGHPTQKPLRVMLWTLGQVSEVKSVLDPWMGSGTTLRAAKDLGLRAIGIEREEKYCAMAVERLAQSVLSLGAGVGECDANGSAEKGYNKKLSEPAGGQAS